jgi:putative addiction module component (TIGR02574 family)
MGGIVRQPGSVVAAQSNLQAQAILCGINTLGHYPCAQNAQEPTVPAKLAEIQAQALQLPPDERARLLGVLLVSLSVAGDLDDLWFEEATRRLAELESGAAVAISLESAAARARAAIW